jgi:hypothetical protein
MDAYGNLTDQSEFDNRRFRLISYLDPDVSVGVFDYACGVVRLSLGGNPRPWTTTIFRGRMSWAAVEMTQILSFTWDHNPALHLSDAGGVAVVNGSPVVVSPVFVDGPWFILMNVFDDPEADFGRRTVLDCAESSTEESNRILWFRENQGDNQKWRAATVGPGLP